MRHALCDVKGTGAEMTNVLIPNDFFLFLINLYDTLLQIPRWGARGIKIEMLKQR